MVETHQHNEDVQRALSAARTHLLRLRGDDGFWHGHLSSSALATAVAAVALQQVDAMANRAAIDRALSWLAAHANADGGWGDTTESPSNLSTTLLTWSALAFADPADAAASAATQHARAWVRHAIGSLEPSVLAAAVIRSYGEDRTFSAPILTVCAMAGRLGDDPWQYVPQLPFELAMFPHGFFRFLRLSVVSYALPALIAIGLVRHRHAPPGSAPWRWIREAVSRTVLRVLRRCQPTHGGFLDAAPLTSFVAASLANAGLARHLVVRDCVRFLLSTVRPDGSWPIDTDLAVWVSTLAINALGCDDSSLPDAVSASRGLADVLPESGRSGGSVLPLRDEGFGQTQMSTWLVSLQFRTEHAFTHAAPGGWGWTHRAGSVPDADDTAGALLALRNLGCREPNGNSAAEAGICWLLDLQNDDGGVPTFCRGWGKLPFDRSCPDITAHVVRGFDVWYGDMRPALQRRMDSAMHAAVQYLERAQQTDGSWLPLWFGNQLARGQTNPTYGTAKVVMSLARLAPGRLPLRDSLLVKGTNWLLKSRNSDGGWGGIYGAPSTIEETALAVAALTGVPGAQGAVRDGVTWLVQKTEKGTKFEAAPIGLYFAKLWYAEQLYPVIFTVEALTAVAARRKKVARALRARAVDAPHRCGAVCVRDIC